MTSTLSTLTDNSRRAACADARGTFHHPLLEDPPGAGAPAAERRRFDQVRGDAAQVCRECPLLASCLYTAVVEHDVAGFVAGTLPAERRRIRRRLAISVAPDNLEQLFGGADTRKRPAAVAKPTRNQVLRALVAVRAQPKRRTDVAVVA